MTVWGKNPQPEKGGGGARGGSHYVIERNRLCSSFARQATTRLVPLPRCVLRQAERCSLRTIMWISTLAMKSLRSERG